MSIDRIAVMDDEDTRFDNQTTVTTHTISDYPERLPFFDDVVIKKGTVDDWHQLKALHYKAGDSFAAADYYRAELHGQLIGVVVIVYPQLLLAERHKAFPNIKPSTETKLTNTYRGKSVTTNWFGTVSRFVVDTQFRGTGIGYPILNLASRMHNHRQAIEIKSAMSRFNPFAIKAGFKFVKPPAADKRRNAIRAFSLFFDADPTNVDDLLLEAKRMSHGVSERARKALIDVYFKHSSRDKAGKNNKKRVDDFYRTVTLETVIVGLQDLCFSTALYGAYINPDYGREIPKELPLSAFFNQLPHEPLNLSLLGGVDGLI